MRSFLLPLLYILFANATTVAIFNKKFGKCLPLTMLFVSFPLFFSGLLFGTFRYGILLNIVYAFLFVFFIFKRRKDFVNNYFSNGFYASIVLYLIVFMHNIGREFSEWDEFSHWGIMVKEMFRLDNFYSIDASTLMLHKDYPPIIPLFNFFWSKLCGGYDEMYLLNALKFLTMSFIIPVIDCFEAKNKRQLIAQTVIVYIIATLVSLFFDREHVFNTIYLECFISFFTGYLLYDIMTNDDLLSMFSMVKYCILLSFLLLTKQICVPLYMMIFFVIVSRILYNHKKILSEKKLLKIGYILLFITIIPIVNLLIWNNYTTHFNVDRQFVVSEINITKIPSILNGTDGKIYQPIVGHNAIDGLFSRSITTSYINLSYIQCAVLGIVLLYLLYKKYKKIYNQEEYIILIVTTIFGFIGYAFVIVSLFIFCFYPEEGYVLNSYDRYLDSFTLIVYILCVMLYFHGLYNSKIGIFKKSLIVLFAVFMIQGPSALKGIENYKNLNISNSYYANYANILRINVPSGSKVFQICQFMNEDYYGKYTEFFEERRFPYYIHYYTNDIIMNSKKNNFDVKSSIAGKTYFDKYIKTEMLKYDYVFLTLFDDAFVDKYSFLFEDIDSIKTGTVFKIINDNGNIILREKK